MTRTWAGLPGLEGTYWLPRQESKEVLTLGKEAEIYVGYSLMVLWQRRKTFQNSCVPHASCLLMRYSRYSHLDHGPTHCSLWPFEAELALFKVEVGQVWVSPRTPLKEVNRAMLRLVQVLTPSVSTPCFGVCWGSSWCKYCVFCFLAFCGWLVSNSLRAWWWKCFRSFS